MAWSSRWFFLLVLGLRVTTCTLAQIQPSPGGSMIPLVRVPRRQDASNQFNSSVGLVDRQEFAYLAPIIIGAQQFLVLLDTGSSDLWVVSSQCAEEDCVGIPKYSKSPSLTSSNTSFELDYLMGSVSGNIASETVALGQYEISAQVLALANATSGLGLSGTGNSGILGLSFPSVASIADTSGMTLLDNLFSSLDESKRFFAFKLGKEQTASSFSIGGLDPNIVNPKSNFSLTPVIMAGDATYNYWKIPIQSFTINATTFNITKSRVSGAVSPIAVLDTGTTLILGPSDDVAAFWESVGGSRSTPSGWQVRCDRAISVGVVLGSGDNQREYAIDPADISWTEGGRDGDWCLGGVQANDRIFSGDWLLGDTFLRNVYVTHHAATSGSPPQVGLLGMTDPVASVANFRSERGDDPTGPARVRSSRKNTSNKLNSAAVCGISAAGGFVFGAILTIVISAVRMRRRPPGKF